MERQIVTQGEAASFAFFHVGLPIAGESKLQIKPSDKLTFSIGRKNRKPILTKVFPDGFEKTGDSYFVFLTAEETAKLPCLLYQMKLTVDMRSKGKEVYTLIEIGRASCRERVFQRV